MYFDHSTHSESSDDSSLDPRNMRIKLKDIANQKIDHNKTDNTQQYLTSSYEELTAALEKEKVKSILSRGNSKNRRKAPPPPPSRSSSTQSPSFFPEQIESIGAKISLNRVATKHIEPIKPRVLERVDYSPLISPENKKMARENISKLLKQHNSQQQTTFIREIPQIQKPATNTRTLEFQHPDRPEVPRLISKSLSMDGIQHNQQEHQLHQPHLIPRPVPPSNFFPYQQNSKLEETTNLWKKELEKCNEMSLKLDEFAQMFQNCDSLESLSTTCIPEISSILKQSFNLHSIHSYLLGSFNNPFSLNSHLQYHRIYPEIDNDESTHLEVEETLSIVFRTRNHHDLYRHVQSSDPLFSVLYRLLCPNQTPLQDATIYCLDLPNKEINLGNNTKFPPSLFFFIFIDELKPSTNTEKEDSPESHVLKTSLQQIFLRESLRSFRFYLERAMTKIQIQQRNEEMASHENEVMLENEIRKFVHQTHSDYVIQMESMMTREFLERKLQSLLTSITQLPIKCFDSPFSWIILQKHLISNDNSILSENSSASCLFHIFDSIGTCHIVTEPYLTLHERYPSNSSNYFESSPIGKLVLGAGLSEQNIANPAIITTTAEKLAAFGLLTNANIGEIKNYHSNIQLLVIPFALSELNATADYSAFVIALSQTSTLSNDFILEQADLIIEMLLNCISLSRNRSQKQFTEKMLHCCDEIIQDLLIGQLDSTLDLTAPVPVTSTSTSATSLRERTSNRRILSLLKSIRNGQFKNSFGAVTTELIISKELLSHRVDTMESIFFGLSASGSPSTTTVAAASETTTGDLLELRLEPDSHWMTILKSGNPVILSNLKSRHSDVIQRYILSIYSHATSVVLFPLLSSQGMAILILIQVGDGERSMFEKVPTNNRRQAISEIDSHEHSLNFSYISPSFQEMISLIQKSNCLLTLQNILHFCTFDDHSTTELTQFISKSKSQLQKCQQTLERLTNRHLKLRYFDAWRISLSKVRESNLINQTLSYSQSITTLMTLTSPSWIEEFQLCLSQCLESLFSRHRTVVSVTAMDSSSKIRKKEEFGDGINSIQDHIEDITGQQILFIQITSKTISQLERVFVKQLCQIGSFVLIKLQKSLKDDHGIQTDPIEEEEEDVIQTSIIPFLITFLPILFPKDLLTLNDFTQTDLYSTRFSQISHDIIHFITDICHADIGLLRLNYTPQGLQFLTKDTVISSEDPVTQRSDSEMSHLHDVIEEITPKHERKKREKVDNQINYRLFRLNGDFQLLSSKLITENEKQFATLASYFLVVSSCYHDLKLQYSKLTNETTSLETSLKEEIEVLQKSLDSEKEQFEDCLTHISLMKKLASFSWELMKMSSLQEVCNAIHSNLPSLIRVKSAALYLRHEDSTHSNHEYRLCLPSSVTMGIQETEYDSIITENHMRKIPNFDWFHSQPDGKISPFKRSKLLLTHPSIAYPLGMILLTEESRHHQGNKISERLVHKENEINIIEKYLFDAILLWTSQVLVTIENESHLTHHFTPNEQFQELELNYEALMEAHETLQEETNQLMEVNRQLKLDKEATSQKIKGTVVEYQIQIEKLQTQYESLQAEHNLVISNNSQEKERIQTDFNLNHTQFNQLKEAYLALETLVLGYAVDSRFQSQHIVTWLYEIAEGMNLTTISVNRGHKGEYLISSRVGDLQGASTVLSLSLSNGIRESLRSCQPVELIGSQADFFSNTSGNTKKYSTITDTHHYKKLMIAVLCVPNRLAGSGLSAELCEPRESICYIFLRDNERSFTEYEKSYLNCAVGLIAKCLGISTVARRNYPENVEKLLQTTENEKENAKRVTAAAQFSAKFCSQLFNSWYDFVRGVEGLGRSVLFHPSSSSSSTSSSSSGAHGIFSIECFVWQPGIRSDGYEYARSSFDSIRGSLENDATAHRVMTNGKSQRNGNVMWIPLSLSSGKTVALLYFEKKIDLRHGQLQNRSKVDNLGSEELKRGSSTSTPSESLLNEQILESISNEELIFTDVDEEIMNIFSIMATGALDRLMNQTETLQSIQTASKAILKLQQNISMLENGMAVEIAQKLKLEEAMKVGIDLLTSAYFQRIEIISTIDSLRRAILTVTSSQECLFITPNLFESFSLHSENESENSGEGSNEQDKKLYFIDKENGTIREVILDPLDIEYYALQTRKPTRSSMMSPETKSWARQHCFSETSHPTKISNTERGTMYSLVVPCVLQNDEVILVVVNRTDLDYEFVDEMAIFWLTKILSVLISQKREELLLEEVKRKSFQEQQEYRDKHLQIENLLMELTKKNQTNENENESKGEGESEGRTEMVTEITQLSQEFFEMLQTLLSSLSLTPFTPSSSSHSPSSLKTSQPSHSFHNKVTPEDILKYYCELIFPETTIDIQTTMESIIQLNSLLADENIVSKKDSILSEKLKFIYWEEGRRHVLRGLLTFPALSDDQLWITIKPSNSSLIIYQNYKIKFLLLFQVVVLDLQRISSLRKLEEETAATQQQLISSHQQEIELQTMTIKEIEMNSINEINQMKHENEKNHEQFHDEIIQIKEKYKTYLQEKSAERKYIHEVILQLGEVNQFLLTSASSASSSSSSSKETKHKSKRSNFIKIIKKICEGINGTGIIDIAVAIVSSDLAPSHNNPLSSTFPSNYLSWISPSTNWIGTSSPFAMSSPIAIAFDMKKKVLVVSTDEKKNEVIDGNPNFMSEWAVVVSSSFAELTAILPVIPTSPSSSSSSSSSEQPSYLIIGKLLPQLKQQHHQNLHFFPIKLLLNTWSVFHNSVLSLLRVNSLSSSFHSQHRHLSLKLCLLNLFQKTSLRQHYQKSYAFSHLKSHWTHSKRAVEVIEENQIQIFKQQIRHLERSLADWTELVKGINGSSSGITNGLPGLWSQACRPLMSMITSHVTLLSCGLMVASDNETVLDLNVEELSTYESYISRYDNHEEKEANIAIRPSIELGVGIQSLAWSILNGQSWRVDNRSTQRLWKLSKGTKNGHEEQMWLVPLRTSTEVLGILRLTVEIPLPSHETNKLIVMNITEYDRYVEEDSNQFLWTGGNTENAKRNLLNFSELFAPLVTATRLIEVRNSQEEIQFLTIEDMKKEKRRLKNEINVLLRKNKLITESLLVISTISSEELTDEEIVSDPFTVICNRLNSPLSVVVGVDLTINSTRHVENHSIIPLKSICYPILVDKIEVGYLIAQIPVEDLSVIGQEEEIYHEHEHESESESEGEEREGEGEGNGEEERERWRERRERERERGGKEGRKGHFESNQEAARFKLDEGHILSLLRVLSIPIASLFLTFSREISIKKMVTTAVASLHTMQHEVDDLTIEKDELIYRELMSSESHSMYQQLYSLMKEITLSYEGYNNRIPMDTQLLSDEYETTRGPTQLPPRIQTILINICLTLQKIFQNKCIFNFILKKYEIKKTKIKFHDSVWYNPSMTRGEERRLTLPHGRAADEHTIHLIHNLANSVMKSHSKSSVDVNIPDSGHSSGSGHEESSHSILRVVTYPLCLSHSSHSSHPPETETEEEDKEDKEDSREDHSQESQIFGVFQICSLPLSSNERLVIEKISLEIIDVLTHLLSLVSSKERLVHSFQNSLTLQNILNLKIEKLSNECQIWKNKSSLWSTISQLSSLFEVKNYEEFWLKLSSQFTENGLQILQNISNRAQYEGERYSLRKISSHMDQNQNQKDIYLIFDLQILSTDEIQKIVEIFQFLFEKIAHMTNLQKKNSNLKNEIHVLREEMKILTTQCQELAQDMAISSSVMSEQSNQIIKLKKQLPITLEGTLRPIIGDILSLFRQISSTFLTSTSVTSPTPLTSTSSLKDKENQFHNFELSVEQSEQFFTIYSRTIAASLSRMLTSHHHHPPSAHQNKYSYHVSVLVKSRVSGNIPESNSQYSDGIVIFDGVSLVGKMLSDSSLLLDPSRGLQSVVFQCFQTNLSQLYSTEGGIFNLHGLDLIGIESQQLHLLSNTQMSKVETSHGKQTPTSERNKTSVLAIPLPTDLKNLNSVIRIIISEEFDNGTDNSTGTGGEGSSNESKVSMIRIVAEMLASLGKYSVRSMYEYSTFTLREQQQIESEQKLQAIQQQFLRYRKLYRLVCHELSPFFDPPVTEISSSLSSSSLPSSSLLTMTHKGPIHPASLSPTAALHDTCLKTLSIVRVLCRSDGQAILIKDPNTRNYQLVYTGNGLSWQDIEVGSFGSLTYTGIEPSLISTILQSRKSTVFKDFLTNQLYNPSIDGKFSSDSSLLFTPLRGRGNAVIGVLLATKISTNSLFSPEDVIAMELIATFSSLGLYWGQGLSSIYFKLSKTITKMEELETSVKLLKENTKRG